MKNSKAENCLKELKSYFEKESISNLATIEYPNSIVYKSDSWIYYIFYSCLLDYGMRSKIYHENLIRAYEAHPEIFDPRYTVKTYNENQPELLNILKECIHPRYPNIALLKWLKLSTWLAKHDDIVKTIKSMSSIEILENLITETRCYGQKTGGLLTRELIDSQICSIDKDMKAIPIDRHDIEISYLNGITATPKPSAKEIENISTTWIEAGRNLGITPSTVDKYLWEVGARFCNKKKCTDCPLTKTCKKGD